MLIIAWATPTQNMGVKNVPVFLKNVKNLLNPWKKIVDPGSK